MYCHLVLKSGTNQKLFSTFLVSSFPIIDNYLSDKGITHLNMHIVPSEEVLLLSEKQKASLQHYFEKEHIEKDYGRFRSKDIRKVKFLLKYYHLSLLKFQMREVYFFNILEEAIQSNEHIILYEMNEINANMIDVLNIINNVEIENNIQPMNITKLKEKIISIKPVYFLVGDEKNYDVDKVFNSLEEKRFITIREGFVATTAKGKLLTDTDDR